MKQQSPFKDETQQHVEQLKSGANSILVAVRIRPLSQKQMMISDFETVQTLDGQLLALMDPGNQFSANDTLRKNRNKETQFAFDYVYDKEAKTKRIYEQLVAILIDGIMDGYNATVLAFGPTGCGKTFTMVGNGENPGIMPLCMIEILSRTRQQKKWKDFLIKVSYIQIYNENIKDLLISQDRNFDLREDPKEGVVIAGVTQVSVGSISQLNTVLKVGNRNRTKQYTGANEASSRSHAILQVIVQSKNKAQSTIEETIVGKMSLVDLAGSQRASHTTNKGQRMVQGAKINQSLLVLGNCIQALSQTSQKKDKNGYVPYRGSKLTRLLKDSLGGNCRTVMISNVSPFLQSFEDTYNTLTYAHRAKSIKNSITRNVLSAQSHLTNYVNIINNLKRQNQQLKTQLNKNGEPISPLKKNTLPLLQNSAYNVEMERIQGMIQAHFKNQSNILRKIHQYSEKIEKAAFQMFKIEISKNDKNDKKDKNNQQKAKSQQHVQQIVIEQCTNNNQQLKKQFEALNDHRQNIIREIKSNDITGKVGQPYLLATYKQKKVQIQIMEADFKYKLYQLEKKEKKMVIDFMRNQLKIRERIIQDQKVLIQKNNIINRITYSQLKKIDDYQRLHSNIQINNVTTSLPLEFSKPEKAYIKKNKQTKDESLESPTISKKHKQAKHDLQLESPVFRKGNSKGNTISLVKLPRKSHIQKEQNIGKNKDQQEQTKKIKHYPSQKVGIDKNLIYQPRKPYYHNKKTVADISIQSQSGNNVSKRKSPVVQQKNRIGIKQQISRNKKQKSGQLFEQIKDFLTSKIEQPQGKKSVSKKTKIQRSNSNRKVMDIVMMHR